MKTEMHVARMGDKRNAYKVKGKVRPITGHEGPRGE
jgi:hypothetical protein